MHLCTLEPPAAGAVWPGSTDAGATNFRLLRAGSNTLDMSRSLGVSGACEASMKPCPTRLEGARLLLMLNAEEKATADVSP